MKKQIFKTAIPLILLVTAVLIIGSSCGGENLCTETLWYRDADADGYGNPEMSVSNCDQPTGYIADNTDCDDTNSSVYPGAPELCDGLDNNCDGEIDNDPTNCDADTICVDGVCVAVDQVTFYRDNDGDGFGDPDNTMTGTGTPQEGWVLWAGDCDDTDPAVNVLAAEIPDNGIDDNCNGLIDNDDVRYIDADGDGYGSQEESAADGVFNKLDCDDTNAAVHPYQNEIPGNGIDDNCDGLIDE